MNDFEKALTECACDYLNEYLNDPRAGERFMNEIRTIAAKFSIPLKDMEEKIANTSVKCLLWGDSPDNCYFTSPESDVSKIAGVIEDSFGGDYGDETNEKIDNLLRDMEENPEDYDEFCVDDPVSGTIECFVSTFSELAEESPFRLEEDEKEQNKAGALNM